MRKILIGIILCFSFCRLAAQEDSIMHNGYNRVYLLYVPSNYDGSAPYSLIIVLHGASGTETSLYNSGFNDRAGIMKYIACTREASTGTGTVPTMMLISFPI